MYKKINNKNRRFVYMGNPVITENNLCLFPKAYLIGRQMAALAALLSLLFCTISSINFAKEDLYHGTSVLFKVPKIELSRDGDFGKGFYTSLRESDAWNMAIKRGKRDHRVPWLYHYEFDINDFLKSGGTFKQFLKVDKDLMTYILKGRKKLLRPGDYDVVCGPTADGNIINKKNTLSLEELRLMDDFAFDQMIRGLEFEKYGDQVTLKTQKAVEALKLIEIKNLITGENYKIHENGKFYSPRSVLDIK